jgi:site-specific DNA recombinase
LTIGRSKVVRKAIRVAFLAPDITEAILTGNHPKSLTLTDLQKTLPLDWNGQRRALNLDRPAVNLQ